MAITSTTPGEFRVRAAEWEGRAKEATSAENRNMMLYAAAGCRERADEDDAEAKERRSVIRLSGREAG